MRLLNFADYALKTRHAQAFRLYLLLCYVRQTVWRNEDTTENYMKWLPLGYPSGIPGHVSKHSGLIIYNNV